MTYYRGDTPLAGASPDQQQIVDHWLGLAPNGHGYQHEWLDAAAPPLPSAPARSTTTP